MKQRLNHLLFHRHLLLEFLRRDLQARYVGSAMGFFWSVINPVIYFAIYFVVFGFLFQNKVKLHGFDEENALGFAFYIFSGILPWYAFQESFVRSTTCIVDNAHLIKQLRFPAKVLPAYLCLSSIVNQVVGTVVMYAAYLICFKSLPWTVIGLPLILLLQTVCFFGLGLLFATLHTYLRDMGTLVSIVCMILMWASPTLYTMQTIENTRHDWIRILIQLNPGTYLVSIHHELLGLNNELPSLYNWSMFAGFSFLMLAAGYWLFTKCHHEFADFI